MQRASPSNNLGIFKYENQYASRRSLEKYRPCISTILIVFDGFITFVVNLYYIEGFITFVVNFYYICGFNNGVPFLNGRDTKGVTFLRKKKGKGLDLGGDQASPYKHFLSTPPPASPGGLKCVRWSRMSLAFPWKQKGKKIGDKLKSYGFQCVNLVVQSNL